MSSADAEALDARQWCAIDEICCRFEEAWHAGWRPALQPFLDQGTAPVRVQLFQELLAVELDYRRDRGEKPLLAEYENLWSEFKELLPALFADPPGRSPPRQPPPKPAETRERMKCPKCQYANPPGKDVCMKCQNPLKGAGDPPSPGMLPCRHCGADMPARAMFCGKCGKSLKAAVQEPAPLPVPPAPPPPQDAAPSATPSAPSVPPSIGPVPAPPPAPVKPTIAPPTISVDLSPQVEMRQERCEAKAELIAPSNSLRPMVRIPTGEFLMGSPEDTGNADEHPQHKVKLSAYFIDRHAVTNLEYERFDPGHRRSRPEVADSDNDPVVMVNHQDCLRYCRWRAEQEKVPLDSYTLPTEAQWERAARGGYPDRPYSWGDEVHADVCNTMETGRRRTIGVDLGIPNGFMLFHMGSNVREWCLDCYSRTYYGQRVPQWIDPQGPAPNPMENFRVVRGASFIESGQVLGRCAARGFAPPKNAQSDIGFRCVRLVNLR